MKVFLAMETQLIIMNVKLLDVKLDSIVTKKNITIKISNFLAYDITNWII